MVSLELIYKALDDSIVKSHQHLTLNDNVTNELDKFAKSTRGRKSEKGILIGDDGEIYAEKKGTKKSVSWGGILESVYEHNGYKQYHIEHNHPNKYGSSFPTCLSDADFLRLIDTFPGDDSYMCKSVTAEDSGNHSRMTIVRGDFFDKDGSGKDVDKFVMLANSLQDKWFDLNDKFESKRQKLFTDYWGRHPLKTKEDFDLFDDLQVKARDDAMESIGFKDELKKVQDDFRSINCKLIFSWVED